MGRIWSVLASVIILAGLLGFWTIAYADEGAGKSERKVAGKFLVE